MKKQIIQNVLLSLLIFTILTVTIVAKTEDSKKAKIAIPFIPIIAEFEYSPYYFSQMLKNHSKYTMIEATFDPNDKSSLEIILTEKESSKRVHYSASEDKINLRKAYGTEAYLTNIDFKMPSDKEVYGIGFSDKYKQPVIWRVTPTSQPSEYGRGVRNIPWKTNLILDYVDFGSTIGEGTAIKIGDKVIAAEPWNEISAPPYFYAYRGSFSTSRYLSVLLEGTQSWKTLYAPDELKKGAVWKSLEKNGRFRMLMVSSQKENVYTIDEIPARKLKTPLQSMELVKSESGLSVRSTQIKSNSEIMQIIFKPELPLQSEQLAAYKGEFVIKENNRTTISKGKITGEAIGENEVKLKWLPKSPKFAKSKSMEAVINFNDDGYSIETRATK